MRSIGQRAVSEHSLGGLAELLERLGDRRGVVAEDRPRPADALCEANEAIGVHGLDAVADELVGASEEPGRPDLST